MSRLPTIDARSTGRATRACSAAEFVLGAGLVVGASVYRSLPNEVLVIGVLALASLRWREGGWAWRSLGFSRPASWRRVVVVALAAAGLRIVLGDFVIDPLTARHWPPARPPELLNDLAGNVPAVLLYLPLVWGFAALGEEWAYRGYLMHRGVHALGGSTAAWVAAAIATAVLFGVGHYYKGPAGMIDSGVAGLILALAYFAAGRTLWASVLAHGFIDTVALLLVFAGWAD